MFMNYTSSALRENLLFYGLNQDYTNEEENERKLRQILKLEDENQVASTKLLIPKPQEGSDCKINYSLIKF